MCGIIGVVAQRTVAPLLLQGLKNLEYRGYDSAGIATVDEKNQFQRLRTKGKVAELERALQKNTPSGTIGIAHTRWATHGKPSVENAHPHISADTVALVHNGIIENHEAIRQKLLSAGVNLTSETDTELVAHLIKEALPKYDNLLSAIQDIINELQGAYALAIIDSNNPDTIIAVRHGSPLVIGVGIGENLLASDSFAVNHFVQNVVFLEEGDIAEIKANDYQIYDASGQPVQRPIHDLQIEPEKIGYGQYRHYMQKEIFEQASAITVTLEGRVSSDAIMPGIFADEVVDTLKNITNVQIIACGTSYHAGLVASYWLEELANVSCRVEIASEFRYRKKVVQPGTLFVCISQSGETADALAALRQAKALNYDVILAICNVSHSTMVREADLVFMTRAGVEVGVASTKAFTTQLVSLLILSIILGKRDVIDGTLEHELVSQLLSLPKIITEVLSLDQKIKALAERFVNKQHALFLGRGVQYPIACEGALKLKELSYIHAEAYPAGELKHGPLALVDEKMPVIAVAPNDQLLGKLKSNLEEVRARGGELIVFADDASQLSKVDGITIIELPAVPKYIAPIIYVIPLQLLAYHVALIKGTDVDQPRNLAKSVTVE